MLRTSSRRNSAVASTSSSSSSVPPPPTTVPPSRANGKAKLLPPVVDSGPKTHHLETADDVAGPPLDLVALRAAALQSKKRKAAQDLAASTETDSPVKRGKRVASTRSATRFVEEIDLTGEMEEGEIGEVVVVTPELVKSKKSLKRARKKQRDNAKLLDERDLMVETIIISPPSSQPLPLPRPPVDVYTYPVDFSPDYPVHLIQAESVNIIDEVMSYGVTPEYLVQIGVSRDIVSISLHELGYQVSPDFAPRSSSFVNEFEYHSRSRNASFYSEPTYYVHPSVPHSPRLVNTDWTELEARHRRELMARKEALALRNAKNAESLASELDSMFNRSGSSTATPIPVNTDDDNIAITSSLPTSHSTLPPKPPPRSITAPALLRRPVAVDFESHPLTTLPQASATALPHRRVGSFISQDTNRQTSLVIDISESEGGDTESEDETNEELRLLAHPPLLQSLGKSPLRSSTPATSTSTSSTSTLHLLAAVAEGGIRAKKALEEKEIEIRQIMERISKMESKKKEVRAVSIPIESSTTSQSRGSGSNGVIVSPPLEKMNDEIPVPQRSEIDADHAFTSYQSPFALHPALRSEPASLTGARGARSSSSINVKDLSLSEAALSAWVAKRRALDPNQKLCAYEFEGKCVDSKCLSTHFNAFVPSHEDLVTFVKANIRLGPTTTSPTKLKLFDQGLTLALDQVPLPLTLEKALSAAIQFWTEIG